MTLEALRPTTLAPLLFTLVPFVAWACGGSDTTSGPPPADTGQDAAGAAPPPPPPVDGGTTNPDGGTSGPDAESGEGSAPSSTYPAPHPPFPTVTNFGGPVLTAPNIVTITFSSQDPTLVSAIQSFDDTITTTSWWKSVSAGYCSPNGSTTCIGTGGGGGHVSLTEAAPTTLTDSAVQTATSTVRTFIQSHVTSGAFPAPTPNTIYAVYFPSTTSITLNGTQSCTAFGAYHYWMNATPKGGGAAVRTAYAVLPDCGRGTDITVAASHEFMEAATDPQPNENTTFYMADPAWLTVWGGLGEVGDLCVGTHATAGSFNVQRIWNNQAALASNAPCEPFTQTYFNTAVAQQVTPLAVGASTTIQLTGYSNAATPDWSVQAQDWAAVTGGTALLQLSIDKTTLNNGETANLTVKLLSAPPNDPTTGGAYATFVIYSTDTTNSQNEHGWPAVIQLQ
jgi:hypothetical protein